MLTRAVHANAPPFVVDGRVVQDRSVDATARNPMPSGDIRNALPA
jgi:hypothetical protein